MNSEREEGRAPLATWYTAMRPWVFPPPKVVWERMTPCSDPSTLAPLRRPNVRLRRRFNPTVGWVIAKNCSGSP